MWLYFLSLQFYIFLFHSVVSIHPSIVQTACSLLGRGTMGFYISLYLSIVTFFNFLTFISKCALISQNLTLYLLVMTIYIYITVVTLSIKMWIFISKLWLYSSKCELISHNVTTCQNVTLYLSCDFISPYVVLSYNMALHLKIWLYISHCNFICHNAVFLISKCDFISQNMIYISQCGFVSQNVTLYLTMWLYISKYDFIYLNVALYLKIWLNVSQCSFISPNMSLNLTVWLYISKYDFIFHNVALYITVLALYLTMLHISYIVISCLHYFTQ